MRQGRSSPPPLSEQQPARAAALPPCTSGNKTWAQTALGKKELNLQPLHFSAQLPTRTTKSLWRRRDGYVQPARPSVSTFNFLVFALK